MLVLRVGWHLVCTMAIDIVHFVLKPSDSDPPRPESEGAVMDSLRAGIAVRMLTGDHVGCFNSLYLLFLTSP